MKLTIYQKGVIFMISTKINNQFKDLILRYKMFSSQDKQDELLETLIFKGFT